MLLAGGAGNDRLGLSDLTTGYELRPYGAQQLQGFLNGSSGNDVLYGSSVDNPLYTEVLSGSSGNDVLYGYGGDDELRGGPGNDNLYAGSGDDTVLTQGGSDVASGDAGNDLLVAQGTDPARLYGDDGWDVMCADDFAVRMRGSWPGQGGWNVMYWSSTSTGDYVHDAAVGIRASQSGGDFSWCGSSNIASWMSGWCDSTTLNIAPSRCANLGLPD